MANPFEKDWNKPEGMEVNVNVNVKSTSSTEKKESKPEPYADITIVIDRSSSMMPMKKAVVDSINQQIGKMKENPGNNYYTLIQFDDPDSAKGSSEVFPKTVFEHKSERDLNPLKMDDYKPRGTTALVDAICKTMRQVSSRVEGKSHVKPIIIIITDGQENSSKEFSSAKMKEMIARRMESGWDFQFLAANQDAWTVAGDYGMANRVTTSYAGASVLSGGVDLKTATTAYTWEASAEGLSSCITSGFIGAFHMASGHFSDTSYKVDVEAKINTWGTK